MNVRQRIKNKSEAVETEEIQSRKNDSVKWLSFRQLFLSLCALIVTCFILPPVLFYISSTIRQHVLFMNYINFSPKINYSNPEVLGLQCSKNFYLLSKDDNVLGIWHILPRSLKDKKCENIPYDHAEFDDDRPVILYLHGSGGNRGAQHRITIYKVLTESIVNAHIVTLDYRGFGDSTNSYLTVNSIVTDAEAVYKWLLKRINVSRIYIWGHSMGAAVALKLASSQSNVQPRGLVMEAPFTNSVEALRDFPLTIVYRYMPFFQYFFVEPFQSEETYFDNTALIGNVSFPLLILHAKDDSQIPYYQGELLYQIALQNGNYKVKFIGYDKSFGYDHLHIARDPDLPNKVLSFMRFAAECVSSLKV